MSSSWVRWLVIGVVIVGGGAAALADGQPQPVKAIKGSYAFDVMSPRKSRCAPVRGALLKKLQTKHQCTTATVDTASGHMPIAECVSRASTYLLFAKANECKEERETQLANGP